MRFARFLTACPKKTLLRLKPSRMRKALSPMSQLKRNELEQAVDGSANERVAPDEIITKNENPFQGETRTRDELFRSAGIELDEALTEANRRLNLISIGGPLAGTVAAILLLPVLAPTPGTLIVFGLFLFVNALGAGVGLHRYFTHRSFEAPPAVVCALGVLGTWAMQGPIARWVADHRRHHRFSDSRFDPHSPYWNDDARIEGRVRGWAHAHLLWMIVGRRTSEQRYAKDILANPMTSFFTRHYWSVAASR